MNMEKLCSINKKKKVAVIVLSHSPGHNSFNSWVSFSCLEKEIALREKKKNVLKLLARLFFFMSVSLLLLTMNTPTLYFCLTKSRSIIFNNNNSNEN